jgi:hypothetical protein
VIVVLPIYYPSIYNSSPVTGEVSVMALLQRPHALAIVTTSPSKANPNQPRDNNYNYNNNLSNTYSNNNNNNNNNSSSSSAYVPRQHTLLMLTTQAPIEDLSMWCVTFMSITTHIREWSALMSIRSDRLMPLAPYLLKASPVVSSVSLRYSTTVHLPIYLLMYLLPTYLPTYLPT